jgi:antirestriction protein ArdC
MGRFVKRGEKGIQILAPMIGYRRKKDDAEQDSNASAKPQPMLIGFRAVYVFDVAQTEGEDLPEFEHNITGEVGAHIALEFSEKIAPALGVSYGGKIALLPGQSKAEEFTTLVHETAHLCCVRSYVV